MNIYVVSFSALYYLRDGMKLPDVPRSATLFDCCTDAASTHAHKMRDWMFGMGPVDLMVPSAALRCAPSEYSYRVWAGRLPAGAFLDAGAGLFMASPELVFLQMGSELSVAGLVQLGLELCGTYRLKSNGSFQSGCEPLTTPGQLELFVTQAVGFPGRKRALRALPWIISGAASPMETRLVIRLCLPPRYGGCSCPLPDMNALLELSTAQCDLAGRSCLYGDLYWPTHKVLVEYNGQEWHSGRAHITSDAQRANALSTLGLKPFFVTADIYNSAEKFDSLVCEIRRALGRHVTHPSHEQNLLRHALPAELGEQEQLTRVRDELQRLDES